MFKLKERIEAAETEGRDIVAEMIAEIDEKIETVKARVRKLALEV